jgi:putative ABC transport system permease protein
MIRGRLIEINGVEPSEEIVKRANALQRELNLTWSADLAEDNKLLEGNWWDSWVRADLPGVSVEAETAKELGVKIGDQLRFSLGGLTMDARVASVRSVDWRSLKPNFFFIFEPGSMESYSPMFMTSIFLSAEQKPVINQLLRKHQSILVLEFDRIIQQMRNIIDQVSNGIQLVLWLTLAAGSLVLFAAVMSSIDSRKQEAGLLRALGSSRYLMLGSVFAEFMILGMLAGVIAIVGAEALLFSLQKFVLQTPIQPHYVFWVLSPVLSSAFISLLGVLCCRRVVTTPPAVVLREAT